MGRQTDGLRRVVSNDAVFDRHFGFHHELLSDLNRIYAKKDGQELEALDNGAISLGRRSALGMTNRRLSAVKKCNGGCPFANPPACEIHQIAKLSEFVGSAAVFLFDAPHQERLYKLLRYR